MRQKVLSIGLAFILIATASVAVTAQESSTPTNGNKNVEELVQQRMEAKQKKREELTEARKARIENRCVKAQEKIQSAADRLAAFQTNHSDVYNRWFVKIADLLTRLESTDGVDAAQLRADIEVLDAIITELQAAFDDYSTQFTELLNQDCTENPEAFYHAIEAARDLRKTVVDGMQTVRDYIQTTIKSDLMDIKDQLKDLKQNDNSGDDDSDEDGSTEGQDDSEESTDPTVDDADDDNDDNEGGQ